LKFELLNCQEKFYIPSAKILRELHRAAKSLHVDDIKGRMLVVFVDKKTMSGINKHFLNHKGLTDVISFKYPKEEIKGEIIVSPDAAKIYSKENGVSFEQELSRYVLHGLLHWQGYDDCTIRQKALMRSLEDKLLKLRNK
jgi:probable rRNA maturation factor